MFLFISRFFKKKLLSAAEEEQVLSAIKQAENNTSAEIRVAIDKRCQGDPVKKAIELFEKLGMTATQHRNGVLIYVSLYDRKFAIIGDIGIHNIVGDSFWKQVATEMRNYFARGEVVKGIIAGIYEAGEVLAKYFPRDNSDINELPDEIVY